MHPTEFYWLLEVKHNLKPQKMYGDLTEREVAAIYDAAYPEGEDSNG